MADAPRHCQGWRQRAQVPGRTVPPEDGGRKSRSGAVGAGALVSVRHLDTTKQPYSRIIMPSRNAWDRDVQAWATGDRLDML